MIRRKPTVLWRWLRGSLRSRQRIRTIRLQFENRLAGAVIDRFGKEVILTPDGEEHFTVSIEVAVSPQFYAWLFGFGTAVEILSPAGAAREMAARAKAVAEMYAKYA